jgi:hypothetical protein
MEKSTRGRGENSSHRSPSTTGSDVMPESSDYRFPEDDGSPGSTPANHPIDDALDGSLDLVDQVAGTLVPPNPVREPAELVDRLVESFVPANPVVPPNPVHETLLFLDEIGRVGPLDPVQEPAADWLLA